MLAISEGQPKSIRNGKLGIQLWPRGCTFLPRDMVSGKSFGGQGLPGCGQPGTLFLHTTSEMLEEFKYLGEDAAKEVVIDNPKAINEKLAAIRCRWRHIPHHRGAEQQLES